MTDDNLTEAVAKALIVAEQTLDLSDEIERQELERIWKHHKSVYAPLAKAATAAVIEQLMEPTPEMLEAGLYEHERQPVPDKGADTRHIKSVLQAVLTAARGGEHE